MRIVKGLAVRLLRKKVLIAAAAIAKCSTPGEFGPAMEVALRKRQGDTLQFYKTIYRMIGVSFAIDTHRLLKSKALKEDERLVQRFAGDVGRFLQENGAKKITAIDTTTMKRINSVLATQGAGETIPTIARSIQSSAALAAMNRARATMIARTETISASNFGSILGARATGLELNKIWIATRDDRTRGLDPKDEYDHISMDTKPAIPLDEAFDVSGEALQYPGDPAGSAGNVINCRCAVAYEVKAG